MNGSFRNTRSRWRSGRRRSIRSASPSRASAPSGRWGPCTSSGEHVTSTTHRWRSSSSKRRFVSVSQRISLMSPFVSAMCLSPVEQAAQPAFAPMPAPVVNLPYVEPPKPITAQHERSRHATSQTVRATRYSSDLKGNRTSGGGIYDPNALTAASRTLPLGSTVKVTDVKSGGSVNVLVNDRGPRGRSLDLSAGAAQALGLDEHKGVTKVKITRQLRPRPPVPSD